MAGATSLALVALMACGGPAAAPDPSSTGSGVALGCDDPVPVEGAFDRETGLVTCADGAINRVGSPLPPRRSPAHPVTRIAATSRWTA